MMTHGHGHALATCSNAGEEGEARSGCRQTYRVNAPLLEESRAMTSASSEQRFHQGMKTSAHAAPQERGTTCPAAEPGQAVLIEEVSEHETAWPPAASFS
jgi:hypothetical protein